MSDLPFPTDPGAFLSAAIKFLSGPSQACSSVIPDATFHAVGIGGGQEQCRLMGGLRFEIGAGTITQQQITVVTDPIDFTVSGVAGLGALGMKLDASRSRPVSLLQSTDIDGILSSSEVSLICLNGLY